MKVYPSYKESGVEWIGNIPKHWDILRLVNVGTFSASGIDKLSVEGQETVRMANYTDVYGNASHELWGTYDFMVTTAPKTKVEEHKLIEGDILFTPSSETIEDIGVSAVVMENLPDVVYSYHLIRLRPFKNLDLRFRKYFCNYPGVYHQFSSVCKGTTRKILTRDNFREIRVALPPLPEQQAIADFLDRKTAQIDTLIEKKKRQIDLLQEKRTALINHAVTKGLNPDVRMKDSGLEWLGEIPSHWTTPKLKWLTRTTSGATPNSGDRERYYDDGSIPWIRTLDLNNSEVFETEFTITDLALQETACTILPEDSVLIAMYGGGGTIGKNGILRIKATTNQAVCAILPNGYLDSYFFFYYVNFYRPFWMMDAMGTRKDPNISQEIIKNLIVVLPPIDEQKEIVKFLLEEEKSFNITTTKIMDIIRLLEEYRTALISEAVTGKIDVRTAV